MGFKRPSLPELIGRADNDVVSRLPGAQAELRTRLTKILAFGQSGLAHGVYGYLQWLERQLFPETCDDDLLHLHSVGVERRGASLHSGPVVFSGVDAAVIDRGTLVQLNGAEYATTADAMIVGGSVTVDVEARQPGSAGAQNAGAVLSLVEPVAGVNATATVGAAGITGGADLETFDSWRDRILARRARIPRGGAEGDWAEWALQVPGVTRAWESPLGMGPGTVVIRIMADDAADGPQPSQQLLEDVFEYIRQQRNVAAHVYVIAPALVPFAPQIRLVPDNSSTRASVERALQDLILRAGKPGGTLLISSIRNAIGTADGVADYELPTLNSNVVYNLGELPVWGGAQWIV